MYKLHSGMLYKKCCPKHIFSPLAPIWLIPHRQLPVDDGCAVLLYVKGQVLLTNLLFSFSDTSKEVMLSVISSISNIIGHTTEHMVNKHYFLYQKCNYTRWLFQIILYT